MPIQKRIALLGLKKQAVKGAAEVSPAAFAAGVMRGSLIQLDLTEELMNVTAASRMAQAVARTKAIPGVVAELPVFPKIIGLILERFLGSIVTVGAGAPFTHTLTPGTPQRLTAFGRYDADYFNVFDLFLESLKLEWDENGPLKLALTAFARDVTLGLAAWTATVNEDPTGAWLSARGGTFLYDTVAAKVKSGSIELSNNLAPVMLAADVNPDEVFYADYSGTAKLVIVPENLNDWRKALTGTTGGTSISSDPLYAALDLKWVLDANTDLRFQADRMAPVIPFPEADPAGGPAELSIEGPILRPASGAQTTFTLRNAQSAY